MTRFFLVSFSCLFCIFPVHSSLFLDKENIDPEGNHSHLSPPVQETEGNTRERSKRKRTSHKDNCPTARKKKRLLTQKTKERVTRLQKTYGFSEKTTLEAHWVHKSISRGARGITVTFLSDIFSTSEIRKIRSQGVNPKNLLINIQVLKTNYPSPVKLPQGNYTKGSRLLSPIGKLYDSRRNKRKYIGTSGRDRVKKRLFPNLTFDTLFETQEVPKKHQLSGIRTRNHVEGEWDRYLSNISDLREYENRLFRSYQESIVVEKENYTLGTAPYPTVMSVQKKFLRDVAPHMTHLQVFYDENHYYDVYFCPKSIEFNEENLERLHAGLAPLGHDSESMHIHHLTQRGPGEAIGSENEKIILVFMSEELHSKKHRNFHFDRVPLFGKRRFVGVNRSLWSSHRLIILEAVYGELTH